MPATGAAASISVNNVITPFGGSMTVYLKNSTGNTIGTNSDSGSWGDETVVFSFDEVMVYSGQTYSIEIDFVPTDGSGSYGTAYLTYTPYYLITVTSAYDSPTSSAYVRSGENYVTNVTSPASGGSGVQYVCTGYSIDGGGATAGTNYTFTSVTADHTIVYNWKTQYNVSYGVSGMNSTASGTVVTVDGVAKTYSDLPFSKWVDDGSSTSFTYADPVTSSIAHYRYVLSYAVSSPQTITAPTTITDTYVLTQYEFEVIFTASGLDSSVSAGTVVTVDGTAKAYVDLPYSKWVAYGGSTSFTYNSTISSSTTGKQFRLSSSVSSPQTITGNTTISDGYTTQYYLTVNANGHSSGVGAGWYDSGSTAYAYLAATTVYDGDYTRYNFASWSGSGTGSYTGSSSTATVTMNAPINETANWQTQYYLTVVGTYASTTGSGWYNSGVSASFNVSSPVSGGVGSQLAFGSWTGSGSGSYTGSVQASSCTMNAPITETANWNQQYYLTVVSSYGSTTGSGWYNNGATAYAGLTSGTVSGGTGVRYNFNSWSSGGANYNASDPITMTGPVTTTASWGTQYYLTVTTAYSTGSGDGWYNSGSSAIAHVATTVVTDGDGTHTMTAWTGDATGSGLNSNSITMSAPKTALAYWVTSGSGSNATVSYVANIYGPFYEDGTVASGDTVTCSLLYANSTVYPFSISSVNGTAGFINISSTTSFVQLQWNASDPLVNNYTRVYRFIPSTTNDTIYLFITRSTLPSFLYSFQITDFYGMVNPYLEIRVSPDGTTSYVMERADLSDGGGTVTFTLTQYQLYTIAFICDQGTYTQSFTASLLGTPGQYPVSLNVLAGNFPMANATTIIYAEAVKVNGTSIAVTYLDPDSNTTYVYIRIYHMQGTVEINDYTANSTGSSQVFLWSLADSAVSYRIYVEALSGGELYTWYLSASSATATNPFYGLFDWLGVTESTLPQVTMGWPAGMTGSMIAQLVATTIITLFLCIGSFRSAGYSCLFAWIMGGIMLYIGWYQGGTAVAAIPEFTLAGFLSILIIIDEAKQTTREV